MARKNVPIKYLSRDFEDIKSDLIDYAKRYYPETFSDFNEASFGALLLDTVAYVGDILSYYVDYQANESFLDTAIEYDNIIKLATQKGYKHKASYSSHGVVDLYAVIPASLSGLGPDSDYLPIVRKGSTFLSQTGVSFILNEDVDFAAENNEVVVGEVDTNTSAPTSYVVKTSGQIISGRYVRRTISIGEYQKFKTNSI